MIKKLWHRIISYRQKHPDQSMRQVGDALGVSKDMVFRQTKRTQKRLQFEESHFWESEAGQAFLKRLIVSTIYTFGIKGGIGAGRIEEFMHQIRISTHAGVSESSIYRLMKEIEVQILRYKELQERGIKAQIAAQKTHLEVVLGLDETWLDKMLLVCQELSSGYLFLNNIAKKETPTVGTSPSKKSSNPSD